MFRLLLALILTCSALPARGQSGTLVASVPEFAAEAMIRDAARLPRKERVLMLDEAFLAARSAVWPLPLVPLPPYEIDTEEGYRAYGAELKLDRVSLQARAVEALLPLDPLLSRLRFEEIPLAPLPRMDCDDTLYPDVSDYYRVAGMVLRDGFTAEERAKGRDEELAGQLVRSVSTVLQLLPLLESLGGPGPYLCGPNLATLAGMIEGLRDGPRAMEAFLISATPHGALAAVQRTCPQDAGPQMIVEAMRKRIVGSLSSVRCAGALSKEALPAQMGRWNRYWFSSRPITAEEVRSFRTAPRKPYLRMWTEGTAQSFMRRAKEANANARLATVEAKQREFDEMLKDIEDWKPAKDEKALAHLHRRCVLLQGLIERAPDPVRRQAAVDRLAYTLAGATTERTASPSEWMYHARVLARLARSSDKVEPNWTRLDPNLKLAWLNLTDQP